MHGYTKIKFAQLLKILHNYYSTKTFIIIFKKTSHRPLMTLTYIYKPHFFTIHLHISTISLQYITVTV